MLELQTLSSSNGKIALVLIFNPDKSMTLLINEVNQSMLTESHLHSNTGAIIAITLENQIHCMINYVQEMIYRDWGPTVHPPFDVTIVKLK